MDDTTTQAVCRLDNVHNDMVTSPGHRDRSQGAAVGALLGPGGVVVRAMVTSRANFS